MILYVSRLVAEAGMVLAPGWWIKPHTWATSLVGYKAGGTVVGARGIERQLLLKPLGVFSMVYTPMLVGNHLLANAMTGFRAIETLGKNKRKVVWTTLAGLAVGTLVFGWRFLEATYQVGALNVDQEWYREVYHIYNNALIRDILLRERSLYAGLDNHQLYGMGDGRDGISRLHAAVVLLVAHPSDRLHHNGAGQWHLVFGLSRMADQGTRSQVCRGRGIQKTDPSVCRIVCRRIRRSRFLVGHRGARRADEV